MFLKGATYGGYAEEAAFAPAVTLRILTLRHAESDEEDADAALPSIDDTKASEDCLLC